VNAGKRLTSILIESDTTGENAMICLTALAALTLAPAYDPLKVDPAHQPKVISLTLKDSKRNRDVPVRVMLPKSGPAAPVVLFSHGLGGSRDNNSYMGNHFTARGYAVVYMQHIGSDDSVWQGVPARDRMKAMQDAASAQNAVLRYDDVKFVIDEISRLNAKGDVGLKGKFDLERIGMSGHSFGAVTTQAVSGQSFPGIGQRYTDSRIDAAVLYSPSAPTVGNPSTSFGKVQIPWLLMTGTHDSSVIRNSTVEKRLKVFPALPAGNKFELVLFEAEHSAFGERALPGEKMKRNPNHHRAILALATAFWDTYLKGDGAAKAWMNGKGPRNVLENKDTWKSK
jgi:predicted dienelactone hydrolase